MTPKEKAERLVDRYKNFVEFGDLQDAKDCALIAVDEIISNDSIGMSSDFNHLICDVDFWQKVKRTIEKI